MSLGFTFIIPASAGRKQGLTIKYLWKHKFYSATYNEVNKVMTVRTSLLELREVHSQIHRFFHVYTDREITKYLHPDIQVYADGELITHEELQSYVRRSGFLNDTVFTDDPFNMKPYLLVLNAIVVAPVEYIKE